MNKLSYITPEIEVVEVRVQHGFSVSVGQMENIGDRNEEIEW